MGQVGGDLGLALETLSRLGGRRRAGLDRYRPLQDRVEAGKTSPKPPRPMRRRVS
jgi:hypothetical protein